MKKATTLTIDHSLFSGEVIGEVSILTFKKMPLLHIADLESKEVLFGYFELLSSHKEIKVLLIKSTSVEIEHAEYINFYQRILTSDTFPLPLERMYNAINQFILQLAGLNKTVIHADSGDVIPLFMNISLACDYRIVADNTVYNNPNIEIDVVPKGGSVFFLSKILGPVIASRVLLSRENLTAAQAHQLGIVDKVVPLTDIDRKALETAQSYAQLPSSYTVGIKRLLSFDLNDLKSYLAFESKLLQDSVRSHHYRNVGK